MSGIEIVKDIFKVGKFIVSPISELFGNLFREKTIILGPSTSGKSTLIKILQNKPYYIGEYNHTQKTAIVDKKNIRYNVSNPDVESLKLKIKKDIPGEDFDAWKEILIQDRPRGIILVVDLYGLVKNGNLNLESNEEFINIDAKDIYGTSVIKKITPREKFELQVKAFETIYNTCRDNNIEITGMSVFINKCDSWLKKGADETEIRYMYKKTIEKYIDLLKMAKDLKMKKDISWDVTSMDADLKMMYLEPAILRYTSKFENK